MKKNEAINTTAKIIIPKKGVTSSIEKKKEEILDNLNSISDFEIENVGTDIECQRIINSIKANNGSKLSMEDIDLLINNGYFIMISRNLEALDEIHHKEVILKIIDKAKEKGRETVRDYLYYFKNYRSYLDDVLASKMIKCGYIQDIMDHISEFNNISKDTAFSLYEKTGSFINLTNFKEEDRKEIALFYIEKGEFFYLEDVDCDIDFANQILGLKNKNKITILCKNIGCFPKELHKEIALNIIKAGGDSYLLNTLDDFEGMDKEVAVALGEHGASTTDLQKYALEARQDVALYLLDKKEYPSLSSVPKLNLDFANKIIERKEFDYLIDNIEYFFQRGHKQIFLSLVDAGFCYFNQYTLKKFKCKDKEIAMTLLNFRKTKNDTNQLKYIANYIAINTNEFTGLDDEVASELIDLGFGEQVKKRKKSYKDLSTYTKMRLLMK